MIPPCTKSFSGLVAVTEGGCGDRCGFFQFLLKRFQETQAPSTPHKHPCGM